MIIAWVHLIINIQAAGRFPKIFLISIRFSGESYRENDHKDNSENYTK